MTERDNGTASYSYELRSTGGERTRPIEQEYTVDVHHSLVRDLVARIDELAHAALDGAVDHRADIAGYAQTLHDTLLPRADGFLPELVTRVAQSGGPLLIRTNEQLIPWELLHDGTDFLGLRRDMGRHAIASRRVTDGRGIAPIRKALIIADTLGDLQAARDEAAYVARLLRAHGADCTVLSGPEATVLAVVQQLRSGTHDLLHFCGHVSDGNGSAGLLLHRRDLLDDLALQPLAALGVPPLVVINGCASASPTANLCLSFTVMGAKAVVGNRHPVDESCARDFATGFYEALLSGATAGTAIRQARLSLLDRPSAAWASFALYGDPAQSISVAAGAVASTPGVASGAAALLAQLPSLTGHTTVTSMHLLLALLTAPELHTFLTRQLGDTRLGMLVELTEKLIAGEPDTGNGPARLSDTVSQILLHANQAAAEHGRQVATVTDLATAFVNVGGGSSRYLLDLCGIAPSMLDPTRPPAAPTDLFDDHDRLRTEHLDPAVREAVWTALLVARSRQMTVSTELLLLSLGLTGNAVLRRCLEEQGPVGAAAIERLMPVATGPRGRYFSARTRDVLQAAASLPGGGPLDTATLLRTLIVDPGSTARRRLEHLDVDVDALVAAVAATERPRPDAA